MKTIKQRISYAVMGLITMGFTACTQNEDMAPTLKGQEINATFTVGGVQTRVNTLEKGNKWVQWKSTGDFFYFIVFCIFAL